MKDYYLLNKESAGYITTYDIKEDTIELHIASKKKHLLLKNTYDNRKKFVKKWIRKSKRDIVIQSMGLYFLQF